MKIVSSNAEAGGRQASALNESLELCVCTQIRRAARAITRLYDEAMQETGIRYTQMIILMELHHNEGITVSALADKLLMDASTVARNLQPLEKQAFIKIIKGKDRRQRLVGLTPLGVNTVKEGMKHWKVAQAKISSSFTEPQFADHMASISALVAVATETP